MSTDTSGGEMEKIDVRVPKRLLDEVDVIYRERGYANRSEFIRNAIRDAIHPPVTLSEEALDAIAESREQFERGETVDLDELDDSEA